MNYAETLSPETRKRARIYAYFACVFGCVSEIMLDSSAVIIIFLTMLGGSDMLTMLCAGFSGVSGALLYIPSGLLIACIGAKRMVKYSCLTGCAGFIIMALAPLAGEWGKYVATAGCFIYCIQRNSYGAAWYVLLDVFLRPEDRAGFFGMMRFIYTGVVGLLLFFIGVWMKTNPPIIFLQIVIAVTGLLVMGRYYCASKFPDNLRDAPEIPDIRKGLGISMKNGPLTAYSVYVGLLTVAYTSQIPLTYLYLKQYVNMNPGTVQIISSVGIAGSLVGYFCYSRFLGNFKLKYLELLTHLLYMAVAFTLFFLDKSVPGFAVWVGMAVFCNLLAFSIYMCNNSAEMLALARPGNKTMAIAFVNTYISGGNTVGRIGTSLILGTAMLAPVWEFGGRIISRYQTFFLISGVMLVILLFLLPTLPSFIPSHDDYYEPKK